jgi:uridine phosphorylase
MILDEFDPAAAVIEPEVTDATVYEVCPVMILTFSGAVIAHIARSEKSRLGGYTYSINGAFPWYIYEDKGLKVGVALALRGAPAVVGSLEEFQAIGFEQFIILGTCGVLDKTLAADRLIVPTSAIRDEGTSYHYAPASDEMVVAAASIAHLTQTFEQHGIAFTLAKTWTTDAFFRETPTKVKRRLAEGATVVDMECASIQAWSQFRQKTVYQFFYTADYVDHNRGDWDERHEQRQAAPMTFFDIALKIAGERDDKSL